MEGGRDRGGERERERPIPSFMGSKMVNVDNLEPQLSDHSCKLIFFLFLMYCSEENYSEAVNYKIVLLA